MQACQDAFPIPGYILDFKRLMEKWKQAAPSTSFADFRQIWKDMDFSIIHGARPDALQRSKWTKLLFESAQGYLWTGDLRLKIGALFMLYMLYQTQPKPGKYKIGMSTTVWLEIFKILDAKENLQFDALAVVEKLYHSNAFSLHASVSIIPPPASSNPSKSDDEVLAKFAAKGAKFNLDTIGEDAVNMASIAAADERYRAHLGNATSILSKDLLTTLAELKEGAKLRIDQVVTSVENPLTMDVSSSMSP